MKNKEPEIKAKRKEYYQRNKKQRGGKMKTESKDAKSLHKKREFSYKKMESYNHLIDPKTNGLYPVFSKKRVCPVCKSNNYKKLFNRRGGIYVKCNSCSMVYTNPVFKPENLKKYYEDLDTGIGEIIENEKDFYREMYELGLNTIEKFKKGGNILEIGCSTGFFLDIVKERNWITYGIEYSKINSEICRKKGHKVYTNSLEDLRFDIKFDVIVFWDCFEHIPDGEKYLELVKKNLRENGLVFMMIPNSDSLATKIMREKCRMFDLEHVNLFNPKTIKMLVEKCGFEIVEMKSVLSEIAVLNNYLNYEDPYLGNTIYKKKLLNIIDEKLIYENLLGYKLQILLKNVI